MLPPFPPSPPLGPPWETYGFKGTPIKMIIKQRGDGPEINVRGREDKKNKEEYVEEYEGEAE